MDHFLHIFAHNNSDPDEVIQSSWLAYGSVVGGILVQLVLGTLFSFGNLVPYFATYLTYYKHKDDYDFENITKADCSALKNTYTNFVSDCNWIFAVAVIFEAGASVIGGKFEILMGASYSCMFGSFILSLGVGLTYFSISNLYLTILTYGLMFGIGAGIAYPGSIVCGMKWWPHRRGMVTGLIAAGFGSGAFFFDYIQTIFVNPDDKKDNKDCGFLESKYVIDQIPHLFLLLSSIYLIMQISGVLLLRDPPSLNNNDIEDEFEEDKSYIGHDYRSLKSQELCTMNKKDYTPNEALKMWKFWQLFFNSITNVTVFLFISAEWKIFASNYLNIHSDQFLSIIGSVSSLCNGLCRILWGLFYDWNGSFAISMGTMCAIMTIFTGTMCLCKQNEESITETMLFLWVCILFACLGGNYTFFPTVVTETFGVKYNGVLIGILLLSEIPSSLIFTFLYENLKQIFGGWPQLTLAMSAFGLASTVLSMTYSPHIKDNNNNINNNKYTNKNNQNNTNRYGNIDVMSDYTHSHISGKIINENNDNNSINNENDEPPEFIYDPNTGYNRTSVASLGSSANGHNSIASLQGASYTQINFNEIDNINTNNINNNRNNNNNMNHSNDILNSLNGMFEQNSIDGAVVPGSAQYKLSQSHSRR